MKNKFGYLNTSYSPFIAKIVEITGCELYLELGIERGHNIVEIINVCNKCIGVDNKDIRDFKNFEFHLETTDAFFEKFTQKPNIIFIDADHRFEQVKKDFINSLNCLSEYGIIFLHDTDPSYFELIGNEFCGDSYKINDWIKEEYPELNIITLPIGVMGLSMVNRDVDRRVLKFL